MTNSNLSSIKEHYYHFSDYDMKAPFASFMPGIAGAGGTPLWCFYTNRGQGICSFGHSDKNNPLLEFKPADQAYRDTPRQGFRTFLRDKNGGIREPFGQRGNRLRLKTREMIISRGGFALVEEDDHFRWEVNYAALPGENYPALIRHLKIINKSKNEESLEVLDGLPRVIPYGIDDLTLKTMSTTAAAWIETNLSFSPLAAFRTRSSMTDSVEVHPVEECHFMSSVLCLQGKNIPLQPLVDPQGIFENDLSLTFPRGFARQGLERIQNQPPVLLGQYPSAFSGFSASLEPGGELELFSLFGLAPSSQAVKAWGLDSLHHRWFREKIHTYTEQVNKTIAPFLMETACPDLDAYTAQTALDNTLRGGMPQIWGSGKETRVFPLYCRKHGDMERDYNDFSLPLQRYSAGFGNYRDMNQNRRIDVMVHPGVGTETVRLFLDLIQPDGYNPLIVKAGGFRLINKKKTEQEFPGLKKGTKDLFTPGDLLDWGIEEEDFTAILGASEYVPQSDFGEGYWTDHWTYNLDLIHQYLRIYPEQKDSFFFQQRVYRWPVSTVKIRPLKERFRRTRGDLAAEDHLIIKNPRSRFLETRSTLAEKLITLGIVKYSCLGPSECGLEMEAGKPGWYDALNGLPGLLGTSLSDGAELLSLLQLLRSLAETNSSQPLCLFKAVWKLAADLEALEKLPRGEDRWLARWEAREEYRNSFGTGETALETRDLGSLKSFLLHREEKLALRLDQAAKDNDGLLPTYYRHEVEEWKELDSGFSLPVKLRRSSLPLFLEGVVKQMKLTRGETQKRELHQKIKASPLYDKKLKMFVLNASLDGEPLNIGRAKAFPSGWLENGSVWLHMEYKYLLELLRAGEGKLFWETAQTCLVPFLDPKRYARSSYENSSFLASSAYPVEACQGRGFVGRLSGATAEYLSMWSEFLMGRQPFLIENGELRFYPRPTLPAGLFPKDGTLKFRLFGRNEVIYRNPQGLDLYPENTCYTVSITVQEKGKTKKYGPYLPQKEVLQLRTTGLDLIIVDFEQKTSKGSK